MLFDLFPLSTYDYGKRPDGDRHGVVLTKPHVVELILDLAGYDADSDLTKKKLLEPSCGHGAFLVVAVQRLMASAQAQGVAAKELGNAILAFDIDVEHVEVSRQAVIRVLLKHKVEQHTAEALAQKWIQHKDFLLSRSPASFDLIVGNPPYVRIEQIPLAIQREYRRLYSTLFDRADLYVAFIERSLQLLNPKGILSFICADRWILNRYGAPLRALISSKYKVKTYVDLHQASPFESEVIAYPSIFVISKEASAAPVKVARLKTASKEECVALASHLSGSTQSASLSLAEYPVWFSGDEPWVLSSPQQLATLRELESRLPLLEADGETFVRIGVASGCDEVYIVPADLNVEASRLLPLVMRSDIKDGKVPTKTLRAIINTFENSGSIELADYPLLREYLDSHSKALKRRHIAKKNPSRWFRTIDRVYPNLVNKPKLLIPDIAGSNQIVFEPGRFYPHHNLYFIISETWDLEVLGALLSSRVALFFVWSYAVKMRGGYLRFQAQYLRRIRVPELRSLSDGLKKELKEAFRRRDFPRMDELALQAYGLDGLPEFEFLDTRGEGCSDEGCP